MASRSIICQSRRVRQIIDPSETRRIAIFFDSLVQQLSYHLITKFHLLADQEAISRTLSFLSRTWFQLRMSRITGLDGTTHEQTIICRQLAAGHVVGSRPMPGKEEKNASNDNQFYWLRVLHIHLDNYETYHDQLPLKSCISCGHTKRT